MCDRKVSLSSIGETVSGSTARWVSPSLQRKSLFDKQQIQCLIYITFLCVPNCLGSKPVSCGVRFSSLFIFPLMVSPSVSIFFPSSHDKQSAFLIRLGKHKTSGWLHLRKRNLHLIKYPPAEALDRRQTTCFRYLVSSMVLRFTGCLCDTHLTTFIL